MSMGNNVSVVGNCTRDPEIKFTAGGQAICSFGVAVNRKWQNRSTQEWEESVSFFDVTAWGQLGENVAESIVKGNRVVVEGRLEQRSWEDKASGDKRSKIEIVADEVSPSLRWATAVVTRNERSDDGGGNRGGGRSSGGGGRAQQAAPAYDMDEEPF
jgi:single-strand DNA-binding protein